MAVYTCLECGAETEVARDPGYPPAVNPRVCTNDDCGEQYGPDLR